MGVWGVFLLQLTLFGLAVAQDPDIRRTDISCTDDMKCPDNAFCQNKAYCVCKDRFVYTYFNSTHSSCLKVARSGEACVQHIQCQSIMGVFSVCTKKGCACIATSHLEKDICHKTAVIGESCQTDTNCYLNKDLEKHILCSRGQCTCKQNYSPRDNGTRCVRDAGLGENCEDQLQCAGPNQQCKKTCHCKDNWVVKNDTKTCVKSVKVLAEGCEHHVQCKSLAGSPGTALCVGGQCKCTFSAYAAGHPPRCWNKRQPGQNCSRDEECVMKEFEPATCISGKCYCKTCKNAASEISSTPAIVAVIFAITAILKN